MNVFGSLCLGAVTKRGAPPSLPGPLVPFADSLISAACSLLPITTAATTVTAVTATAPTTVFLSPPPQNMAIHTHNADIALPFQTTTTTITTIVPRGICDADAGYYTSSNGIGNEFRKTTATSSLDCCQKCQAMQNCVANGYIGDECQLLIKTSPASGAQTTELCPLGKEDFDFGPFVNGGLVFRGPCGY